jgi:hypothetical protein
VEWAHITPNVLSNKHGSRALSPRNHHGPCISGEVQLPREYIRRVKNFDACEHQLSYHSSLAHSQRHSNSKTIAKSSYTTCEKPLDTQHGIKFWRQDCTFIQPLCYPTSRITVVLLFKIDRRSLVIDFAYKAPLASHHNISSSTCHY